MDDETRNVLIGIYQHLRHDHERISDLQNVVAALLTVLQEDPAFLLKYEQALYLEKRSDETKRRYQRDVDLIDAAVAQLSRNPR